MRMITPTSVDTWHGLLHFSNRGAFARGVPRVWLAKKNTRAARTDDLYFFLKPYRIVAARLSCAQTLEQLRQRKPQ